MRLDDAERRGHSSWRGRTGSHAFTAKWEDTYPSAVMVIPLPAIARRDSNSCAPDSQSSGAAGIADAAKSWRRWRRPQWASDHN
jgi:hypothetical protein